MSNTFFQPRHLLRRRLRMAGRSAALAITLLCGIGICARVHAETNSTVSLEADTRAPASRSEIFLRAQTAYDAGRYSDAADLYGQLITNAVDNVEVHYNRANALFREGDLPAAVLSYRTAWYLAPRDPDIRANLLFALNAAGAVESDPSLTERVFTSLSKSEWIILATFSYALLSLVLILCLLLRLPRKRSVKLVLVPALLILLSAGGWHYWRQFTLNPECVIMDANATALFGPIEGSTAHYKVPMGALVQQVGMDTKGWVEIEYDGKRGWLKEAYIKRIYP